MGMSFLVQVDSQKVDPPGALPTAFLDIDPARPHEGLQLPRPHRFLRRQDFSDRTRPNFDDNELRPIHGDEVDFAPPHADVPAQDGPAPIPKKAFGKGFSKSTRFKVIQDNASSRGPSGKRTLVGYRLRRGFSGKTKYDGFRTGRILSGLPCELRSGSPCESRNRIEGSGRPVSPSHGHAGPSR